MKPGDHVLIELFDRPDAVGIALGRAVRACGGKPFFSIRRNAVLREWIIDGELEDFQAESVIELERMQHMSVYIAIRGSANIFELSDVPAEKMALYQKAMKPVQERRVNHTRWAVLRWPTASMAQQGLMASEAFEDFYFAACLFDYRKMLPGMRALKALMERTKQVRIVGPGTDLHFSIENIPAIVCAGEYNLPDGEVFTAPIKDSVNGTLQYNAPTVYQGISFDDIALRFESGKIVEATSSNTKALNKILDTDAGARYIGEFAIGVNPLIREPMRDILFDEKICGSFHFTPGQAYEMADNSNRSSIHWDMVCIQRPEYGGGEIYFDGELIRKDGVFVVDELKQLDALA